MNRLQTFRFAWNNFKAGFIGVVSTGLSIAATAVHIQASLSVVRFLSTTFICTGFIGVVSTGLSIAATAVHIQASLSVVHFLSTTFIYTGFIGVVTTGFSIVYI
ncbi:hypothetical protein NW765_017043 [Fusarium oxysporum]|nr:hypothetical protein NW765_017043 [Fusarium oxysporum]